MQDIIMPQPGSIIWTAAVFLVLIFVLKKWAWGPIVQGLQAREDGIKKDIEDAKNAHNEAEELLKKYQKQLDDARKESQKLISEATTRAEALHEEKKAQVEAEAQSILEKAKADIELERQKAAQELRQEVVEIAITAAGKVIGQALRAEDHRDLIQREIDGLN
ncbi:ATP synthase F0 subunit B [candidate division LCP-89 bacterium B3_LCP]|uniref:ATP synthase subunit b n=1 Tax=candidate division LCP-89 bacterium B3_LCP TaxID=2012998 RepID=A0A532UPR7_UNCL8|nr:MAG: ATP synthase F0 subunit B [candidate division LCP-89 bacterium B3_LCP]